MIVNTCNPSTSKAETGRHLCKFKTTLIHILSSRSVRATRSTVQIN